MTRAIAINKLAGINKPPAGIQRHIARLNGDNTVLKIIGAAIATIVLGVAGNAHAQADLSPRVKAAIIEECDEARKLGQIDLATECFNDVVSVAQAIESNPTRRFKDHPSIEDHPSIDPSAPPPSGSDTWPSCKAALILCKDRPCYAQVADLVRRGATCELAE